MLIINKSDMQAIIKGACILGSGGGGSYQFAQKMIDSLDPFASVRIAEPEDIPDKANLAVVADIGSPLALLQDGVPLFTGTNALTKLESYYQLNNASFKFSYILPIELGAINTATPLLVAANSFAGLSVLNGDGAGRSIPMLQLTTLAGRGLMGPIVNASNTMVFGDCNSSVLFIPPGINAEATAEAAIQGLMMTEPFGNGVAGLSFYTLTGIQVNSSQTPLVVWGGLTDALAVGRLYDNPNRVNDIVKYLGKRNAGIVFTGRVVNMVQASGSVNVGYIVLKGTGEFSSETLWIYNQNENLYAQLQGNNSPLILPPDSICYLPTGAKQVPFDNSDLWELYQQKQNPEVAIMFVEADQKMTTSFLTEQFESVLQQMGYPGGL